VYNLHTLVACYLPAARASRDRGVRGEPVGDAAAPSWSEVLMRAICACVILLLSASSASAQGSSNATLDYQVKWATMAGVGGAAIGGATWLVAGPCKGCASSKGRSIAIGAAGGFLAGLFVSSFSAPSSAPDAGTPRRRSVVAPYLMIRSNMTVQPAMTRKGGVAIVRLRF
jgi:hypothetical protein